MKAVKDTIPHVTVTSAYEKKGELKIFIFGSLLLNTIDEVMAKVKSQTENQNVQGVIIDLGGIEALDSAGAMMLLKLQREMADRSISLSLLNLTKECQNIISLLDETAFLVSTKKKDESVSVFSRIGKASLEVLRDAYLLMNFLGTILISFFKCIARPGSIRWRDVMHYIEKSGVEGLPIVGLISFLVGLIIAFMSSLQLKLIGGNIFVASLVGIAMVKELAPLMTAIIVAGRSGSAFAAEIGTMAVNEELDALSTMGFDPVEFLAVPRIMAALIAVPLLCLYADLFGLTGGLVVGVLGLDLTVGSYVDQTAASISIGDIATGVVKSVVFAGLIAGIGCHRGLQVKRGAEGVGAATTSAVVSAIFLIVLADSIFAVVLNYL
ncbi:MAG: MlaE family lipid ABC transporter permease subunit [Syntrophales bacterium]|nr:MlaE family lipid ABC transporter permease subunit [Syntrophales bacterium]MDY0043142.1 MlaE family lipid ABC transporter permease subunit [Syntrophales bacterium]